MMLPLQWKKRLERFPNSRLKCNCVVVQYELVSKGMVVDVCGALLTVVEEELKKQSTSSTWKISTHTHNIDVVISATSAKTTQNVPSLMTHDSFIPGYTSNHNNFTLDFGRLK